MKYRYVFTVRKLAKPLVVLMIAIAVLVLVEPYYVGIAIVLGVWLLRFMYSRFVRWADLYRLLQKRNLVCREFCEKYKSDGNQSSEHSTRGFGTIEGILCEKNLSISHEGLAVTFVNGFLERDGFIPWKCIKQIDEAELWLEEKRYDIAKVYLNGSSEDIWIPWTTEFRELVPDTTTLRVFASPEEL